jgi:hypothetical protein
METSSPRGYTRNRGPVAPRWIPLVLGIDFEGQETHRKNTDIERSSRSDLPNGRREPKLGAPRIHGELLMLGFDISERTISRWMKRAPKDPQLGKRWLTFLRNHKEAIAAMDFFTVPSINFGLLYCFFITLAMIADAFCTSTSPNIPRACGSFSSCVKLFPLDPLRGFSSSIAMPSTGWKFRLRFVP